MKVLVTGSNGFLGKNLVLWLKRKKDIQVFEFDSKDTKIDLTAYLKEADILFHLAGVNRPEVTEDFLTGNVLLTEDICHKLLAFDRKIPIYFSSSIQAKFDNPYGSSKRIAEEVLIKYSKKSGATLVIYRLPNIFGKWSRPNYNSVVATFCYNISHELPITISEPYREIELIHIDDVISCLINDIYINEKQRVIFKKVQPSYYIKLGQLADMIRMFRRSRRTLILPDFNDDFTRKLYGTYLSYLDPNDFAYSLRKSIDHRGSLSEFMKSHSFGQIFVSRTEPGVTRGNHFHNTKAEKFLVLEGKATIRFRNLMDKNIVEYRVSGDEFRVLDIPTGFTHSIENIGKGVLVTLFWASEPFDPDDSDTFYEEVKL